jgi:hypothetical protein
MHRHKCLGLVTQPIKPVPSYDRGSSKCWPCSLLFLQPWRLPYAPGSSTGRLAKDVLSILGTPGFQTPRLPDYPPPLLHVIATFSVVIIIIV